LIQVRDSEVSEKQLVKLIDFIKVSSTNLENIAANYSNLQW